MGTDIASYGNVNFPKNKTPPPNVRVHLLSEGLPRQVQKVERSLTYSTADRIDVIAQVRVVHMLLRSRAIEVFLDVCGAVRDRRW